MTTVDTVTECMAFEPNTGTVHLVGEADHSLCGIPNNWQWEQRDHYTCHWCEHARVLADSMLADADRDRPHRAGLQLRGLAMAALAAAAVVDPCDPEDDDGYNEWLAGFQSEMYWAGDGT